MYNNGFTYYYNDGKTYILCADNNGTMSWELPEDCVAYAGNDDEMVIETPSDPVSSDPVLLWWQDIWYSWGMSFSGYYNDQGVFQYCYYG